MSIFPERVLALRQKADKPNPQETWQQFESVANRHLVLCGNVYFWITQDATGKDKEVYCLDPFYVVAVAGKGKNPGYFEYRAPVAPGQRVTPIKIDSNQVTRRNKE